MKQVFPFYLFCAGFVDGICRGFGWDGFSVWDPCQQWLGEVPGVLWTGCGVCPPAPDSQAVWHSTTIQGTSPVSDAVPG